MRPRLVNKPSLVVRVLLLADTHIGYDWPLRPRVRRRRRGPDFLEQFRRALQPARDGRVDLVVHGGDLLHRPRLPATIVQAALAPLLEVAERGIPVFLVPGNHERSRIPFPLLAGHRNLHVFHRPHTFRVGDVAVSGFPFARRVDFAARIEATGWRDHDAPLRLLCVHQAFPGARVGVQDFMFRRGPDVVPQGAIPAGFDAVLSGHIHRAQAVAGFPAPVLYPGSVERTSFAEREETKGYLIVDVGAETTWRFVPLEARPMYILRADEVDRLRTLPPDAVVRVEGIPTDRLRRLAPPTMNVSIARGR